MNPPLQQRRSYLTTTTSWGHFMVKTKLSRKGRWMIDGEIGDEMIFQARCQALAKVSLRKRKPKPSSATWSRRRGIEWQNIRHVHFPGHGRAQSDPHAESRQGHPVLPRILREQPGDKLCSDRTKHVGLMNCLNRRWSAWNSWLPKKKLTRSWWSVRGLLYDSATEARTQGTRVSGSISPQWTRNNLALACERESILR